VPLAPLVVATIFAHAAFNGSRLTISLFALSEGASPLTVGVLMSLFSALPMLVGVSAGRLVDRVGIRRPILACVVVLAVAIFLPGAFPLETAPGDRATPPALRLLGGGRDYVDACIAERTGRIVGSTEKRRVTFVFVGSVFLVRRFHAL